MAKRERLNPEVGDRVLAKHGCPKKDGIVLQTNGNFMKVSWDDGTESVVGRDYCYVVRDSYITQKSRGWLDEQGQLQQL